MFAHRVTMSLKTDSHKQLSRRIDQSIMLLLKQQKGFIDGTTLVSPERSIAIEDTYWKTKDDAEAYQRIGYLKVQKMLSEFVKTMPKDSIFEVPVSNIYQIGMDRPYLRASTMKQ